MRKILTGNYEYNKRQIISNLNNLPIKKNKRRTKIVDKPSQNEQKFESPLESPVEKIISKENISNEQVNQIVENLKMAIDNNQFAEKSTKRTKRNRKTVSKENNSES